MNSAPMRRCPVCFHLYSSQLLLLFNSRPCLCNCPILCKAGMFHAVVVIDMVDPSRLNMPPNVLATSTMQHQLLPSTMPGGTWDKMPLSYLSCFGLIACVSAIC